LRARERLLGTFIKTPHPAVIEVLGATTLDCLCIDAEHAPFDRGDLDVAILAAHAVQMPVLVRTPSADPSSLLNVLDLGATGVVIPHIFSAESAERAAMACRYVSGGRGYAGSTRAAHYGTRQLAENLEQANRATVVIAQIEDAKALEHLDAIAAVDAVDAIFVGRMDLTVSLGAKTPNDPVVIEAVERICAAARRHDRAIGMFTPTADECGRWLEAGATLFLLSSDQQWLLQGARAMRQIFDSQ
jgi:2-keto-3-deoxy-L-rhamnonate aldolase RhmA